MKETIANCTTASSFNNVAKRIISVSRFQDVMYQHLFTASHVEVGKNDIGVGRLLYCIL